jgi:hypothetical protein
MQHILVSPPLPQQPSLHFIDNWCHSLFLHLSGFSLETPGSVPTSSFPPPTCQVSAETAPSLERRAWPSVVLWIYNFAADVGFFYLSIYCLFYNETLDFTYTAG